MSYRNDGGRPPYRDNESRPQYQRDRSRSGDRFDQRGGGQRGYQERPRYDDRDPYRGPGRNDRDDKPYSNYGRGQQDDRDGRYRRDEPREPYGGGRNDNRDNRGYGGRPDFQSRDNDHHRGDNRGNMDRDRGSNYERGPQRRSRSRDRNDRRGSPPRDRERFGQRPQFNSRPQGGGGPRGGPSAPKPSQVNIVSNQYKMTLSSNCTVSQYPIEIQGMEMWDADLVQRIVKFKAATMEKCFGLYVVSGKSIYLLSDLSESVSIDVTFRGAKYTILIDSKDVQHIQLSTSFVNDQNSVHQSLINIIIKRAFRDTNLKQIGKTPKFFDVNNFIDMPAQKMKIFQGFKASAQSNEFGCTFVIDSIFKFQSTQSCGERMEEIRRESRDNDEFMRRCRDEFVGNSIIADWGNQRQYIVEDINFELTPSSYKFDCRGEMISLAEYFSKTYQKECRNFKQPLFLVKISNRESYLPTEFCLVDGVPASIKKGGGMRDCLARTRIDPAEKSRRIMQMVQTLSQQKSFQDWGFAIDPEGTTMETQVLATPQMLVQQQVINCDERTMREASIGNAVNLTRGDWIIVHERNPRTRDQAREIFRVFQQASGRLKIRVEDPEFIEVERESNCREELSRKLDQYIMRGREIHHPLMVIAVLNRESNYPMFKEVMHQFRCPSQVITSRNASKFVLAKATNILRQINSKVGGDLYFMKFPEAIESMRTMLVGIDVCHAGPQSIVGFSASTNKQMSQYFSDYLVQRKGQEIVQTKMKELCEDALHVFRKNNDGQLPTNFVIYRDGVGDAQRNQVLNSEIPQLEEAIRQLYKDQDKQPSITVIVVNKRIHQRFFVKDPSGRLVNPPSGCIIDKGLVDTHLDSKQFDFYLTPSSANQGCVLPTHFYCSRNDSELSRFDIEQLTYALCHFYYNWAGPIKVPAPCQYAHKIAEFFMTIGANKRKAEARVDARVEETITEINRKIVPLNERLHFL